jgi:hypothetical protein
MADDDVIRVRVVAPTLEALRAFLDETKPDLGCRPAAKPTGDGYVTDVYIAESRLGSVRAARSAADVVITVVENTTAIGLARQADVGTGNRFAARGVVPRGLGRKEKE